MAEFLDDIRHAEALQRGDFRRDEPEHGSEAILLFQVVAAEAGIDIHLVGKVEIAAIEVFPESSGVADFREEVFKTLAIENLLIGDGGDRAMDADLGHLAFG